MPELPEVEVAARQLRAWMRAHRIVRATAARSRVLGATPRRFAQLAGHHLIGIERFGKWMVLELDGGEGLVSHLGMTGKWIRRRAADDPPSHVRASLSLADGHVLDYRDPRLFGRLVPGRVEELRRLPAIRALGPDPLAGIDVDRLHALLSRTRRSIKEALMDQRTLAGLGNIHVGEALHRARLHPARAGLSLRREETDELARAIGASLQAALAREDGPEPITYVEEGGENFFLVYDRRGERCRTCRRGTIERLVQGGRSTFFCPVCQPVRSARRAKRAGAGPARRRAAR